MPDVKYPCPCCGEATLPAPADIAAGFVCPNCWWEVDTTLQNDFDPSAANGDISLDQARANYKSCGFCDPRISDYI